MAERLQLTDFLDVATLQQIQDQFAAVTGVQTSIRNAQDQPLTRPSELPGSGGSCELPPDGPTYFAAGPIELDGQRLGAIVMETRPRPPLPRRRLEELAETLDLPHDKLEAVAADLERNCLDRNAAAIGFLHLLANAIARLCFQEFQLRRRVEELSAIYRIAGELAGTSDLQQVLDLITRTVVEAMKVKGASLRLLDAARGELLIKSVYGLSPIYLNKGPVLLEASQIDRAALNGQIVHISDLSADPRVLYPAEMRSEGLVGGLVAGMIYRERAVGVIHLYTSAPREFTDFDVSLLRAIAYQAAAAIVNTELQIESRQAEWTQRQLEIARDVQRRMIPAEPPRLGDIDLAGLYTPCFELGGDFYDFIELPDGHLGLAIADVVGKGVAASLMMASARSSLRAYAFQYRDLSELVRQVNRAICRDTLASEFVTLFYAELDPVSLRMRYCNAGHDPPLLLRKPGQFEVLQTGGTIVGAFDDAAYTVAEVRLSPGDLMLLYTDGLVDSANFRDERYDLARVREALLRFADQPARQILGNIRWEVRKFTGLTPRVDDLTMVALKVL